MAYGPDDEENPPGYYNTVSHPNPGASLPAPPGPHARRLFAVVGAAFLIGGIATGIYLVVDLLNSTPASYSGFVMGRYVAAVAVPVPLMALGYILLRHAGDTPRRLLKGQTRKS